jgi:hypothetical protein
MVTKTTAMALIDLTHSSCRYRGRYSARFFIKPRINLPSAWKDYVNNSSEEDLIKLDHREDDFAVLYKSSIKMKAVDNKGFELDGYLYDHILKWMSIDEKNVCFCWESLVTEKHFSPIIYLRD